MLVREQKTGSVAVGGIVAVVLSFISTFAGHPVFGLITGVISIPLGAIGLMMAASPRVSGGMLSIAVMIFGLIAVGVAVLGGVGKMLF